VTAVLVEELAGVLGAVGLLAGVTGLHRAIQERRELRAEQRDLAGEAGEDDTTTTEES
jgi:hypothetical protein